jgi:hypothetical protein
MRCELGRFGLIALTPGLPDKWFGSRPAEQIALVEKDEATSRDLRF